MNRIAQTTTTDVAASGALLVDFDSVLGEDRKPFHQVPSGTTVTATVTIRSITGYGRAGHSRGIVDGDGGDAQFYLPRDYRDRLTPVLTEGATVKLRGTATKVAGIPVIGVFAAQVAAQMTDREQVIASAIDALESGSATPPDGQDPESMANMLKTASERGGLGAFAAYKTAQRINARAVSV